MKVLHIQYRSTHAGDFAYRLHQLFRRAGIDSSVLTLYNEPKPTAERQLLGWRPRYIAKLDQKLQDLLVPQRGEEMGKFSFPILGNDISKHQAVQDADVIYLHWVLNGFLNLRNLEQLARLGKPIVFILHDMWSITGGCHYALGCEQYLTHCSNCPMLAGRRKKDLSFRAFEKKARLYSTFDNLYFVAPSSWLYECAKRAALTRDKPVFHIANVLDREKFKPFDRLVAKEIVGVDSNETVIAFGAASVNSPYKGWAYLIQALQMLYQENRQENISVLVFGDGTEEEITASIPFKTKFLGRVSDEYAMSVVYNAADVFIAPSLADNLPYVIYESLACGTPVVAFNTGGIPDMVVHRSNGYLAAYRDAEDLARGLHFCLDHELTATLPPALDNRSIIEQHLRLFDYIKEPGSAQLMFNEVASGRG